MKKIHLFTLTLVITLIMSSFSACSLLYDQSKDQNANSKQSKADTDFDFSVYEENKQYESNRIMSSDFPVTYRAKPLSTF